MIFNLRFETLLFHSPAIEWNNYTWNTSEKKICAKAQITLFKLYFNPEYNLFKTQMFIRMNEYEDIYGPNHVKVVLQFMIQVTFS